jgi:hypothetical protein
VGTTTCSQRQNGPTEDEKVGDRTASKSKVCRHEICEGNLGSHGP